MSGPQEPEMIYDSLAGGPYVEQTGEPQEAAPMTDREYAETILADAPLIHAWSAFQEAAHRDDGELREHEGITAAFESIVPLVAALVAAAEERGRVEGAAKERERARRECAEELRNVTWPLQHTGDYDPYGELLKLASRWATP